MRKWLGIGFVALAGCSTAPVAGLLDRLAPSRVTPPADGPRDRVRAPDPPARDLPPPELPGK